MVSFKQGDELTVGTSLILLGATVSKIAEQCALKGWTRQVHQPGKIALRLGQKLQECWSAERLFMMWEQLTHLLGRESKLKHRLNKTNSWSAQEHASPLSRVQGMTHNVCGTRPNDRGSKNWTEFRHKITIWCMLWCRFFSGSCCSSNSVKWQLWYSYRK